MLTITSKILYMSERTCMYIYTLNAKGMIQSARE